MCSHYVLFKLDASVFGYIVMWYTVDYCIFCHVYSQQQKLYIC